MRLLSKWRIKSGSGVALNGLIIIASIISFGVLSRIFIPINYSNLGGAHSWLSGSTIIFVNNWLKDGVINDRFTTYEIYDSIENSEPSQRSPYLSYPTGEAFFVFSTAKVLGKDEIGVSFVHKFQMALYCLGGVLFALFVSAFLDRTLKYRNKIGRFVISVATMALWVCLPTCTYYLSNTFFADQCIIFWVMAFVLVEYIYLTLRDQKNKKFIVPIRAFLVFAGTMTDYYFWVLVFCCFVAEVVLYISAHKKKERKISELIIKSLGLVVPVVMAIITFGIQLSFTPNWLSILRGRFNQRVGGNDDSFFWSYKEIIKNFIRAFTPGGKMSFYLIAIILAVVIGCAVVIIRNKKARKLVVNPGVVLIIACVMAILMQLFLLKNHSAIHEFSMLKVAWFIALLPLFMTVLLLYKYNLSSTKMISVFIGCFVLVAASIGLPASSKTFFGEHYGEEAHEIEYAIREQIGYEDVLFSFTYEAPINPPHQQAIIRKRVYQLDTLEKINEYFPNLNKKAQKVLVVEKGVELKSEQKKVCDKLISKHGIRYEDENIMLINIGGGENTKKD